MYDYTYRLTGVNFVRPGYGIRDDLAKLEAWATRFHSDFTVKKVVEERKNYYGVFEMTDPVAHQLENARLI
jgi:hypothetical protein